MSLNKIYPALVQKAERKNRTKAEKLFSLLFRAF
ncbi:hypothetical protein [Latilactobacillus sakei]|nr:hypothetical protein [Latilactobacillus sakei]MDM5043960.1 hypothetical protein [Latilactobacillus sakei]MDR7925134.1 hypothetical protein [Latilactobacillus sakei subsp. sakei]WEY51313.1 hypothetical protein P3T66_06285 [Latilactobacillus sakei]